ncbi:MAG: ribosomal protein L7/L12 [Acidimicrobiales bacterium]|nr:ribosomal protein L7/L12 [Acidimicrobiales bacterium]
MQISVIKAVRELTGYGLAEAKQLVDAADQGPAVIATGLDEQLAGHWVEHLQRAGARVSARPAV